MTNNYKTLLQKIDSFIRKYYTNLILKGLLISITIISFVFLLLSILEYYNYYTATTKTIIFYIFILFVFVVIADLTILPLLKYFRIGKIISHQNASQIISKHYSEIKDKLLNILELASSNTDNLLVLASVDQKIQQIKFFDFKEVINLKQNLRYLKYFFIPFIIFLYLIIFKPTILFDGTNRFVNYSTQFQPEAPFNFILLNDSLDIRKGNDITLKLEISGKYVPSEIYIDFANSSFLMSQEGSNKNLFTYDIKNVNNQIDFIFQADNFKSSEFTINVLSPPVILDFLITSIPPIYTGEESKIFQNVGDLTIPVGTTLKWDFNILNIDSLYLLFNDSLKFNSKISNKTFTFSKQINQSVGYKILASNQNFINEQVLNFNITIIPDFYPEITVDKMVDTTNLSLYYFRGYINDDYGFTNLSFNYAFIDDNNVEISDYKKIAVDITYNQLVQEFYYYIDFNDINIDNNNIKYFFEISDNDKVFGAKSTKSRSFQFNFLTFDELTEKTDSLNQTVTDNMTKANKLVSEIQSDINKFQKKSLSEDMTDWEQQNFMDELLNKQKTLDELLKEMMQKNSEKNNNLNSFTEQQKKLLEKQQMMQDLLNQIMNDDIKDLLEQIKELQDKFDKDLLKELTDKLEMSYDDVSKNLDRDLELLKKFQVEEKVNNTIEELNNLAEKLDELSEETLDKESSFEDLKKENQDIAEEFDKAMEEYKEAQELNQDLEKEMKLDSFATEESEISEEMKSSEESLDSENRRKSSKSQQNASDKMKQMAEQMQSMMEGNQAEQASENEEDLKQLLSNLINFSFAQEDLISLTKTAYVNDPSFNDVILTQKNIKADFEIINDSLDALAKRVPQIGTPVITALSDINQNLSLIDDNLSTKKSATAAIKQQLVMTYTNDLALLLEEVLQQMQQQQQGEGSGSSSSKNKKPGNPSMGDLKGQQQSLQKQLEKMLEQLKENGGSKEGGDMNQQLAKMLAEQEMFEKMLQDLMNGSTISPEGMQQLNEINEASDEIKKDIINNTITPETLIRQKEILTRLLEAENSENERELEEKREAKEAVEIQNVRPEDFFNDTKEKNSINEYLQRNSIKLKNYYKSKYELYINGL